VVRIEPIDAFALGRRGRIEQKGLFDAVYEDAVPVHLVSVPLSDVRTRNVTDVVEVVTDQGAQPLFPQTRLRARKPVASQAPIIDIALKIHAVHSRSWHFPILLLRNQAYGAGRIRGIDSFCLPLL
jgi:hypothetical protein